MDSGEVIPGLNEPWTFAGAKLMEWMSGFVAAIIYQEIFITNLGRSMPYFIAVFIGVPILLATIRKTYPDEERGLCNHLSASMGVCPPGLPKPARLQPIWAGNPVQELDEECDYEQLELDNIFGSSAEKVEQTSLN